MSVRSDRGPQRIIQKKERRMRPLVHLVSCFLVSLCSLSSTVSSSEDLTGHDQRSETVLSLIEQAYRRGDIDREAALVNKAYALFEPDRLAPQFRQESAAPSKCGTPVVLEILAAWEELSPSARKILSPYFDRPPAQHVFNSPGGHFKIHYDTSGPHAVYRPYTDIDPSDGIPDYVNRCAEIFDHVRVIEVDVLGYDAPPSDDTKGGDDRYDVYLRHDVGAYGATFPEDPSDEYPERNDWTSYISVDPTYDGFGYADPLDPLSVTAAHEFFHAIQLAYNIGVGIWYMEISSVWMEDILYDDVNDYRAYLRSFFDDPEISLDASDPSSHPYGSCIWNFFLSENYGTDIVRQIWERCITSSPLSALDTVLRLYGTSRDETFRQFTVWNYLTGTRANGFHPHYEEASEFPSIHVAGEYSVSSVFDEAVPHAELPYHLASNYVRFTSDGSTGDLKIFFTGDDRFRWRVSVVVDSAGRFTSAQMSLDGESGVLRVSDWQDKREAVLIPCVVSTSGGPGDHTFTAVAVASERPDFVSVGVGVDDSDGGDGDGYIDPGETVGLALTLANFGASAANVTAILATADPEVLIQKGIASFGDIGENGTGDNSADPFLISVVETAGLHKAACALTLVSNGGRDTVGTAMQFVVGHPNILLVDDDHQPLPEPETFDVEGYYQSPLDDLDEIYDYWTVESGGAPDSTLLREYKTVIWFTGYAAPALTLQDESHLGAFLQGGGRLFITGQDIASELSSDFLRDYIKTQFVRDDSRDGVIYGVPGDPISDAVPFFSIVGEPGADNQVSPDVIEPLEEASVVFTYGPPSYEGAGVKHGGDSHRVVLFGFGFEGIVNLQGDSEALRRQLMADILRWLNVEGRRGDVDGDGRIELPDLMRTVNIILGFDPLPTEYELWAADCTGDSIINVFDVLGMANVILGIGTCPPD